MERQNSRDCNYLYPSAPIQINTNDQAFAYTPREMVLFSVSIGGGGCPCKRHDYPRVGKSLCSVHTAPDLVHCVLFAQDSVWVPLQKTRNFAS